MRAIPVISCPSSEADQRAIRMLHLVAKANAPARQKPGMTVKSKFIVEDIDLTGLDPPRGSKARPRKIASMEHKQG